MAVAITVTLPAQPAAGRTVFQPLGGDGKSAPLGCYFVTAEVDGDASGGNAVITIRMDDRYTNLVPYLNLGIQADAAAGDFMMRVHASDANSDPPRVQIVGTIPQIATAVSDNGQFLWYPPPIFFQGNGIAVASAPNVGVGETYKLQVEVLVFDIDVRRLAPLPWLMLNVPGVSAPAAI